MKFRWKNIVCRTGPLITVLFAGVLLFSAPHAEAQSIVTEQNIRDAIMGRQTFNQDQLNQLDLNKDGKLDVADLVKHIKSVSPGTPVVGFEAPDSTVGEDIGAAKVRAIFSEPFTGTLNYTTTEDDAAPVAGTVQVSKALTADIPFPVADDRTITDGRMITVSLESGTGYAVGSPIQHLLNITDNDAKWFATLETNSMGIGFDMDIIQDASSVTATLISDGTRGLPKGTWPVQITMTPNTFYAKIGTINVLPSDGSAVSPLLAPFGTDFTRVLVLEASNGSGDSFVKPEVRIAGNMTDTFTAVNPKRDHFDTTVRGTFNLVKEIRTAGGSSR